MPLCNRAAKARHQQRRLELQQLTYQLQETTSTLRAEVEVAVRNVDTAFREMHSKYRAMLAADAESKYLNERWRNLPGEDQVASFLLEDLLDAQERQAAEEADFVTAQVTYTVALAELKRATGTLLQAESITTSRACADGLPQILLDKYPTGSKSD
jgi:outer membrane protein TolC